MDQKIANRYQLNSLIGTGGMGQVYAGIDTHTDQVVAIKLLKPDAVAHDPDAIKRFEREGDILRQLNHPNIVAVLEVVESKDQPCIVMELVEGGSLADAIDSLGPLPVERTINIALELADALARAHHLEIIHRDIKPHNVLLAEDGTPRLTDFGLALQAEMPSLTSAHMIIGTLDYLSPEALNGEPLDTRTDIWSFGVMLFEMLAGLRPFRGDTVTEMLKSILTDPPMPDLEILRPDIPDSLATLIYSMLEKDRERRIDSMRRVAVYLEDIKNGKSPDVPTAIFERRAPADKATLPHHNLPQAATPFIGREDEIQTLISELKREDCRLLSLVGPGGIGKTRLALEVAAQCVDDYEEGVFAVELAAIHAADDIPAAIGRAVGFQFSEDERSPQEQIVDYLREKQMLLVLDNFEHLLDGVEILDSILSNAPQVKILATSREILNLDWEWVHTVRGMSIPDDAQAVDLDEFSAVRLFTTRAKRVQPRFDLNAERECAVHICRLVDGMPLGIELAASWLRMLTCQELASEISQNLDVLTSRQRIGTERHRSLRAVFDYSWNLLSTVEQETLSQLSIFPAPFRREAARHVANASLAVLSALVDKSLLRVDETGWYDMHPLLQQYAAEKLADDPEIEQATRDRHSHYYLNFVAERAERVFGADSVDACREIDDAFENEKTAFQWASRQGDSQHIEPAIDPMEGYLAYASTKVADRSRFWKPMLDLWNGPIDRVYATLQALVVCHSTFSSERLALLEHQRMFDECQNLLGEYPDDPATARAFLLLADAARVMDRPFVRSLSQVALQHFERLGQLWGVSYCNLQLAGIAINEGQWEEAGQLCQQGLRAATQSECPFTIARVHRYYAVYLDLNGETEAALQHIEAARDIYRSVGDPRERLNKDIIFSVILVNLGRLEEARALYEKALSTVLRRGERPAEAEVRDSFGLLLIKLGEFDEARHHLENALAIREEYGDPNYTAIVTDSLGELELTVGNLAAAQKWFHIALSTVANKQLTRFVVFMTNQFARLCARLGDFERSAELLGFTTHHPTASGVVRDHAEPLLDELRTKLDADVLDAVMERGKQRQLEDVVTELLEDFAPDNP